MPFNPYAVPIPSLEITPALCRIHAHLCGDGAVYFYNVNYKDRKRRASILYFNSNKKLIDEFRADMLQTFGVRTCLFKKGKHYRVRVFSIKISRQLLRLSEYGTRKWRIPQAIFSANKVCRMAWFKAFVDDDGYITPDKRKIVIKSMNPDGLKDIMRLVNDLSGRARFSGPNCDKSYYLNVARVGPFALIHKEPCRR